MIDVKEIIWKYSIAELNETADAYYNAMDEAVLSRKPFIIPGLAHLIAEVSHLSVGLDLRPGDRVLDFGCGTGWTSRILNACGCDVVGVDVSATALDMAASLTERWRQAGLLDALGGPPIDFQRYDGYRLDLSDASFDKIFVLDAFHHVPDQAATLREFSRVLKPGGIVGLCEPGPSHSKHPDSQREMALHKVVENDIVLDEIKANASAVGFESMRVCLSPLLPMIVDHDEYKSFPADVEVVQRFLAATNIRVKNYPVFFLHKVGERLLDSRGLEGLSCRLELHSPAHVLCQEGDTPEIRLTITNTGSATWLPSSAKPGSVNIGYTLDGPHGATGHRTHLSSIPVLSGHCFDVSFRLPALAAGHHTMRIDLVSERVVWFEALGSEVLNVIIEADRLSCRLELHSPAHVLCQEGDTPEIRLTITNTGIATWLPSSTKRGSINIGYTLDGPHGTTGHRTHLSSIPVPSGHCLDVSFRLPALAVGHYTMEIDLVSEHVVWFKALGNEVLNIAIETVSSAPEQLNSLIYQG